MTLGEKIQEFVNSDVEFSIEYTDKKEVIYYLYKEKIPVIVNLKGSKPSVYVDLNNLEGDLLLWQAAEITQFMKLLRKDLDLVQRIDVH